MPHRWDIFCQVIDNFGDIGVCWRLARQLQREHQQVVRLWVDDLASFSRIAPDVNPDLSCQVVQSIEIHHWQQSLDAIEPADVVIEAFACELPETYMAAMLQQAHPPVWINLEYLSAEDWVRGCHGLPSPHPRLPLTRYFFFPGFVPGTGGLLRDSTARVQQGTMNALEKNKLWERVNIPAHGTEELRISLFCYDHAPIDALIAIWSNSPIPVFLIVPHGSIATKIAAMMGNSAAPFNKIMRSDQLSVQVIPFMSQDVYDQLLWACDINFVRGEDSFVRAQWALHPFVWHIYPQTDNAHETKLDAFLKLYTAKLPLEIAQAVITFWRGWNGVIEIDPDSWASFAVSNQALGRHGRNWADQLRLQDDLASNLVRFVRNRL